MMDVGFHILSWCLPGPTKSWVSDCEKESVDRRYLAAVLSLLRQVAYEVGVSSIAIPFALRHD